MRNSDNPADVDKVISMSIGTHLQELVIEAAIRMDAVTDERLIQVIENDGRTSSAILELEGLSDDVLIAIVKSPSLKYSDNQIQKILKYPDAPDAVAATIAEISGYSDKNTWTHPANMVGESNISDDVALKVLEQDCFFGLTRNEKTFSAEVEVGILGFFEEKHKTRAYNKGRLSINAYNGLKSQVATRVKNLPDELVENKTIGIFETAKNIGNLVNVRVPIGTSDEAAEAYYFYMKNNY